MSHGSSPAAWTAITIALIGFVVGGIGLVPGPNWTVFFIGVGIVLVSAPVWAIMAAAGYGVQDEEPVS